MSTQQNQNDIQKKGVKPNPSRDMKYSELGEEEINPSELDNTEVDLDRGGAEFGGGEEEGQPSGPPDEGMSSDLGGEVSKISRQ